LDFAKKMIQAALFMSPKALSASDLCGVIGSSSPKQTERIAEELMQEFNSLDLAFEIVKFENGYQMRVKSDFEETVSQFAAESQFRKSVMKTLALIAYKQPIEQAQVVKFRNNKAYDHIARLMEEGFITKQPKGRTYMLHTTKKFLDYFGSSMKKENLK